LNIARVCQTDREAQPNRWALRQPVLDGPPDEIGRGLQAELAALAAANPQQVGTFGIEQAEAVTPERAGWPSRRHGDDDHPARHEDRLG
jgi:hypothetical protein